FTNSRRQHPLSGKREISAKWILFVLIGEGYNRRRVQRGFIAQRRGYDAIQGGTLPDHRVFGTGWEGRCVSRHGRSAAGASCGVEVPACGAGAESRPREAAQKGSSNGFALEPSEYSHGV